MRVMLLLQRGLLAMDFELAGSFPLPAQMTMVVPLLALKIRLEILEPIKF